jgi:hypothetical protein
MRELFGEEPFERTTKKKAFHIRGQRTRRARVPEQNLSLGLVDG